MESPVEAALYTLYGRHEYFFSLKDDKGLFRTNKTLLCTYVILAESKEEADKCLEREIDIAFKSKIEDLSNYQYSLSDAVYSSEKWKKGLLYYDSISVPSYIAGKQK